MEIFKFGIDELTVSKALAIARGEINGILSDIAVHKIQKSRDIVAKIAASKEAVYGINTGFGPLCDTQISPQDTKTLQYNILKSHSVGVGDKTPKEIAKLMLVLKVHSLAQGYSGVSVDTLHRIIWHINEDIIPIVPQQGSVGASGDLAPLAHLFLPLIGFGKLWLDDEEVDTTEVFAKYNLESLNLGAKEGLALINGTQFIAAYGVKVVEQLHNCLSTADIIGGLMVEALLGSASPFNEELHTLRPYPGNQHVAHRLRSLVAGSEINTSHLDCDRVQDPYSLRCMPQVHGASRTAWLHLKEMLQIEINAVTDNPIIIDENLSISGGNFHGQPMAIPLDYACIAASELGSISERRTYLSISGFANRVPKLLMKSTGLNSAFMMPQYTAAALVSENKGLCFPASADSIPTSLGQEDHVSMGSIGGRKALTVVHNVEKILAIELMYAAQALDFHSPLKPKKILHDVHQYIRSKIDHAEEDRIFADDINIAIDIIKNKELKKLTSKLASPFDNVFESY